MHPAGQPYEAIDRGFVRQGDFIDLAHNEGEGRFEITFRGLEIHYPVPSLRRF